MKTQTIQILVNLAKKQKIAFFYSILFILFRMLIGSFIPRLFGQAIDILTNTPKEVFQIVFIILIFSIIKLIFFFYSRYFVLKICEKIKIKFKNQLFKHILLLKNPNIGSSNEGKIIQLLSIEIEKIIFLISNGFNYLVCVFFLFLFTFIQMAFINLQLTLIVIFPVLGTYLLIKKTGKKIYKNSLTNLKILDQLILFSTEKIHAISLFRNISTKKNLLAEYRSLIQKITKKNLKLAHINTIFQVLLFILVQISIILLIILGYQKIIQKAISIGDLVAFLKYIDLIGPWILYIGTIHHILLDGYASIQRFEDLIQEKKLAKILKTQFKSLKPSIEIKNLNFKYKNQNQYLFKNLNLKINPKDKIAIYGPVGSGKTTLIKLLFKSIDIYPKNTIFIQNIPIENLKKRNLTRNFLYIPENAYIFDHSILKNISLFKEKRLSKKIQKATKIASINQVIHKLPKQYYEKISQSQKNLSGGQKQRIHISRAFFPLKKNLFILDTPFSNIDIKTEKIIIQQFKKYLKHKTIIIISPKYLDTKFFNRILYLKNNQLIEKSY